MSPEAPALAAFLRWEPWGVAATSEPIPGAVLLVLFAIGACFGSFLNVVIHRLPRGQSIVWPPSSCPACRRAIRPWDNVPILSWMALGGRCRDCRAPIGWRYPLVEAMAGLLVVVTATVLGLRDVLIPAAVFALVLLAVAVIDVDFRIIPDELSLGGLGIGLFARGFSAEALLAGLLGAVIGGGALWVLAAGYRRATGVDGLGGGDVKLAAMIGAFLGWPGVFLTVFAAALAGSIVGAALVAAGRAGRRTALPFGAFLAPAAVVMALAGPWIWRWYASLVGFVS